MKLYYSPGACSFAPHVALVELGIPFEAVKVDLRTHKLADGTDYHSINRKGYVPVLELDDGTRITEVAVLLQHIADLQPGKLAPAFGTMERTRLMEWLNFIATEIHKGYGPLWYPDTPAATRETTVAKLRKRYEHLDEVLAKHPYLTGQALTVADIYLHTVTNWARHLKVDLSAYPNVLAFQERMAAHPSVAEAKRREAGGKA